MVKSGQIGDLDNKFYVTQEGKRRVEDMCSLEQQSRQPQCCGEGKLGGLVKAVWGGELCFYFGHINFEIYQLSKYIC